MEQHSGEGTYRATCTGRSPGALGSVNAPRERRSEAATRTLIEQLRKGYREGVLEINERQVAQKVLEAVLFDEERHLMAQDKPCFRRISRMIF